MLRGAPASFRLRLGAVVAVVGCSAGIFMILSSSLEIPMLGQVLLFDPLANGARVAILVLTAATVLISTGGKVPGQPAEFLVIVLLAAVGMSLMAASTNLLIAFVALELASLGLYVLTGFDKRSPDSAEAGLKYFLFGGVSAACLLFGFSLIYGLSGSLHLPEIAAVLAGTGFSPLLAVALVMVVVGFGFKVAAAPFHLWAPDAYQGAPVASAAFIASASKVAGIALFFRLFWSGLVPGVGSTWSFDGPPGWFVVLGLLAAASLLLGNFAAIVQGNLRRLLAYSAIAHAGIMLLGVMIGGTAGTRPLLYYVITYAIATVGAFGIVATLEAAGVGPRITDLAGLWRRSPVLAACLSVFVLSLAGIPPLAGFFGKFFIFAGIFSADADAPLFWLMVLAILMSAVSLYYYLIVLKHALIAESTADAPIEVTPAAMLTIVGLAAATIALGLTPSALLAAL
jgi:NADH-quinone oxidoreductase subunit N